MNETEIAERIITRLDDDRALCAPARGASRSAIEGPANNKATPISAASMEKAQAQPRRRSHLPAEDGARRQNVERGHAAVPWGCWSKMVSAPDAVRLRENQDGTRVPDGERAGYTVCARRAVCRLEVLHVKGDVIDDRAARWSERGDRLDHRAVRIDERRDHVDRRAVHIDSGEQPACA